MIIVELRGGLGNQLFQFARGYAQAKAHDVQLRVDTRRMDRSEVGVTQRSYELDGLGIELEEASASDLAPYDWALYRAESRVFFAAATRLSGLTKHPIVVERTFSVGAPAHAGKPESYLIGYWQSPMYFDPVSPQLRRLLTNRQDFDSE